MIRGHWKVYGREGQKHEKDRTERKKIWSESLKIRRWKMTLWSSWRRPYKTGQLPQRSSGTRANLCLNSTPRSIAPTSKRATKSPPKSSKSLSIFLSSRACQPLPFSSNPIANLDQPQRLTISKNRTRQFRLSIKSATLRPPQRLRYLLRVVLIKLAKRSSQKRKWCTKIWHPTPIRWVTVKIVSLRMNKWRKMIRKWFWPFLSSIRILLPILSS